MADTVVIDGQRALTLLEECVAERGEDYEYEHLPDTGACLYAHGDKPGCIVGLALHKAGVPMSVLQGFDLRTASIIALLVGSGRTTAAGVDLSPAATETFRAAQSRQDNGATWGAALAAARHALLAPVA